MNKAMFAGMGLLALWGRAYASDDLATGGGGTKLLDVKATERTVSGALNACEVTYSVAFSDLIYRNGGVVMLRGAVSVMKGPPGKAPAITLKVTPFDFVNDQLIGAPINYAYLSVGDTSYAGKEYVKFRCEDGGFCAGYELLKYPELGSAIGEGFRITFNRSPTGSDVSVPLFVLRDRPEEAVANAKCMSKLLDAFAKEIDH